MTEYPGSRPWSATPGCWGSPERYRTWPEEQEKLQALTARLNRKEEPCL